MIQVCDTIMGTGKSSAAINYMNEHSGDKFIYITPYLDEAERIKNGCPDMNFVEPSDKIKEFGFKKSEHTAFLIRNGANITTTHQAFKRYTAEMLDDIREQGYTLLIDENVDILERYSISNVDLDMLVSCGYAKCDDGTYSLGDVEYTGVAFKEVVSFLKIRDLIYVDRGDNTGLYYWILPPSLLTSFKDVIIMTYLFDGQSLHHMLKMCNIPYEYIGIRKRGELDFCFCEYPGYTPDYVYNLPNMLHILENDKLNSVGDEHSALSKSWFEQDKGDVEQLKRNISNIMKNIWCDTPAEEKLWGSFKGQFDRMKGKGYTKSFLTFNTKATNEYKDRKRLVYIANIFMNPNEKFFYRKHGIEVDDDRYALSIMVQWIWRSAIRDGQEVYLYIPSKRMREILKKWIDDTTKGGNAVAERMD